MSLKRDKINSSSVKSIDLTPVKSSSITRIGYDPQSKMLHIEFKNGSTYAYHDVSEDHYQALMQSKSMGKHVATVIRQSHKAFKL